MVQADYHQRNPYHNSLHATDVTQAMYCFLRQPKVSPPWTRPRHWVLAGHFKRGQAPSMTKGDTWTSLCLTDRLVQMLSSEDPKDSFSFSLFTVGPPTAHSGEKR